MKIEIDKLKIVSDNGIAFQLHLSKGLKKYFLKDTCYIQYDTSLNVQDLEPSILYIPLIASITPITWAVGADIDVPSLDATYLRSLAKVKDVYRSLHPNFLYSGDIVAKKAVTNMFRGERTGMLFTGGVDSLTTYLRYAQKRPVLFSVQGLPDLHPFWDKAGVILQTNIQRFADLDGLEVINVKTDMISNLNLELLSKDFKLHWFRDAAFGLFLLSLCAPVTAISKIGTMVIASGRTENLEGFCGSLPSIDNNIAWADVRAIHDGYELSRQQKIRYICNRGSARYLSHLRVCWEWVLNRNCGNCEKCFRTIAGLVVEGTNPNDCNFKFDKKTLPHIINCFRKGKLALDEVQLFMWRDIQEHISNRVDTDINGSREFLSWLKGYDLSKHRINRLNSLIWETRRMFINRRLNLRAVRRKLRCYYHIYLDRLENMLRYE